MKGFRLNPSLTKKVLSVTLFISILTVVITVIASYLFITIFLNDQIRIELLVTMKKEYLLFSSLLFLCISTILFLFLRRLCISIHEPIHHLTYGFNEIARGNFNVKLEVGNHPELGELCLRFNDVTEHLTTLVDKIIITNEKMDAYGERVEFQNLQDVFKQLDILLEKSMVFRELQRAEKMNAIGQLAASVAHEIRNPMTVVKGFLQIFLAKEHMTEEERMYIRLMIEEMERAETIINDYLSLAKPDMEKTERLDAKELAEKALDLMNSYAKMTKNIILITPILENVTIKGNKNELQQVLINILKNGIEALKDGGELSFKLYQEGSYGVFEITDTGIGMTQEEVNRLGTAFYSLKEKGTGMGLTVCYQIIERMRGKIEVMSEKGVGTTFKIFVPVSKEPTSFRGK
ncbi:ATP-binding protein [Niallia sp. Krafla_26]|uniref:ATP-binding protein n=1 Tax=Niallia sp. Krafla_26 TaxID=3064703 RepID=UPI003D17A80D